jgi:hypothetical protein
LNLELKVSEFDINKEELPSCFHNIIDPPIPLLPLCYCSIWVFDSKEEGSSKEGLKEGSKVKILRFESRSKGQ